jgi:hypothetical protein
MNNVPHIFKTDCGNYVAIEGDFVDIYYYLEDFMALVDKLNNEQLMGYPDTFEFLRDRDRYDILCEGRDFYKLKPAKIEIL